MFILLQSKDGLAGIPFVSVPVRLFRPSLNISDGNWKVICNVWWIFPLRSNAWLAVGPPSRRRQSLVCRVAFYCTTARRRSDPVLPTQLTSGAEACHRSDDFTYWDGGRKVATSLFEQHLVDNFLPNIVNHSLVLEGAWLSSQLEWELQWSLESKTNAKFTKGVWRRQVPE